MKLFPYSARCLRRRSCVSLRRLLDESRTFLHEGGFLGTDVDSCLAVQSRGFPALVGVFNATDNRRNPENLLIETRGFCGLWRGKLHAS